MKLILNINCSLFYLSLLLDLLENDAARPLSSVSLVCAPSCRGVRQYH
jgi:hypothetical protein